MVEQNFLVRRTSISKESPDLEDIKGKLQQRGHRNQNLCGDPKQSTKEDNKSPGKPYSSSQAKGKPESTMVPTIATYWQSQLIKTSMILAGFLFGIESQLRSKQLLYYVIIMTIISINFAP